LRNTGISPKRNLKNLKKNLEIKEMLSRTRNPKSLLKELLKISISEFG